MSEDIGAVFARIYTEGRWGGGSGIGSWPANTIEYRAFLARFMHMNSVRSVVDVGCGDWQSTRLLDWSAIRYDGYDVVASLVTENQVGYGCDHVRFHEMPADPGELATADLLICKDVLMHLPIADIHRLLAILPRYRFALISNDYWWAGQARETNMDIPMGEIRPLDVAAPPFCLRGAYVFEHMKPHDHKVFRTFLVTG